MTREKILEKCDIKIKNFYKTRSIIATLPLNEPIVLTVSLYGYTGTPQVWEKFDTYCACIPINFGTNTVRFKLIAVEKKGRISDSGPDMSLLRLSSIIDWRKLNPDELPLLIGWEETSSVLEQLIKFPQTLWTATTLMTKKERKA